MDPLGYQQELYYIKHDNLFTYEEKKWILRQIGELK